MSGPRLCSASANEWFAALLSDSLWEKQLQPGSEFLRNTCEETIRQTAVRRSPQAGGTGSTCKFTLGTRVRVNLKRISEVTPGTLVHIDDLLSRCLIDRGVTDSCLEGQERLFAGNRFPRQASAYFPMAFWSVNFTLNSFLRLPLKYLSLLSFEGT